MMESASEESRTTVWTIGHSTRTFEEFASLLKQNRIEVLVDVRHFPSSKHVPWTNRTTIESKLASIGIRYVHLVDLGGYRKPNKDSGNTGLRSRGFRGYADHMASPEFDGALNRLIALATKTRTAIMCAEAVPWRCHRSLLSDALVAGGVRVVHIVSPGKTHEHRLTKFAKVAAGRVTYPGSQEKLYKR